MSPRPGDVHRVPTRPNITGIQINNSLYLSYIRIGLLQWFDWGRDQGARIRDKPGDIYRIAKASILGCRRMQGCRERRRKERSRKQVGSVPPVLDQRLTRQTPPHGLAESLLPRVGGCYSELFRRNGAGACCNHAPAPPPFGGGGGGGGGGDASWPRSE
jgi:hypothetical protein